MEMYILAPFLQALREFRSVLCVSSFHQNSSWARGLPAYTLSHSGPGVIVADISNEQSSD